MPTTDSLPRRGAKNSLDYVLAAAERGITDDSLFSYLDPCPQELVTTEETINDTVTLHLGDGEKYKISAAKRGFLKVEHTARVSISAGDHAEVIFAESKTGPITTLHDKIGKQITSSSTLTSEKAGMWDIAVRILAERRNGERVVTTDDPALWEAIQYWRTPLKEIVFKIPRGYDVPNDLRLELQVRIEELLRGRKGLLIPDGETEPDPQDELPVGIVKKRKWFRDPRRQRGRS
jgi:hypothetical protein